jgi:hypothetical protein
MTLQRKDNHSTEFGIWLRQQKEIDSSLGYVATNIDFLWKNYKNGLWMFIEEKRYGSQPKEWQRKIFKMLNAICSVNPLNKYCGFHLIVFEKTSPDDGKIYLDNNEITRDYLLKFLQFET